MDKLRMQRFDVALPQVTTVVIAPDRRPIGFLIEGSSSLQHCGFEVASTDILVYGHGVLHQRSDHHFRYATMSLPEAELPVLCRTIMGREVLEQPRTSKLRPDPALMGRLRSLHKAVGQLAQDLPDLLEQPEVRRALEEQLVHVMVRCLAEGAGVESSSGEHRHGMIMARFEEYLAANRNRPIYLTEICAEIDVSERTLRACCEEHLGMGPVRFLALRRMHLVRQALLRADPSGTTVTRVVTDHGFWELGRFSVAYRTAFGESPSQTLRRPAAQNISALRQPRRDANLRPTT